MFRRGSNGKERWGVNSHGEVWTGSKGQARRDMGLVWERSEWK